MPIVHLLCMGSVGTRTFSPGHHFTVLQLDFVGVRADQRKWMSSLSWPKLPWGTLFVCNHGNPPVASKIFSYFKWYNFWYDLYYVGEILSYCLAMFGNWKKYILFCNNFNKPKSACLVSNLLMKIILILFPLNNNTKMLKNTQNFSAN